MGKVIDLPVGNTTIPVLIHQHNSGALVLAKTLLSQFISQGKNYHAKTFWFLEEIVKCGIKVLEISATEQLGDLFTKGIPKPV